MKIYLNPTTEEKYIEGNSITRRTGTGLFSGIPSEELLKEWGFEGYLPPVPEPPKDIPNTPNYEVDGYGGIYIVFYNPLQETLQAVSPDRWPLIKESFNDSDEPTLYGVLVIEETKAILISPTEFGEALPWSLIKSNHGIPSADSIDVALKDLDGQQHTASFLSVATEEEQGNSEIEDSRYAFEYCNLYNKGNGTWWLPSLGELLMVFNHRSEINTALTYIDGSSPLLLDEDYWSSTLLSYDEPAAINFRTGVVNKPSEDTMLRLKRVRPVSSWSIALQG